MSDKFYEYYNASIDRQAELSEYVHLNFMLIHTKMLSEMRRKLDIDPNMNNAEGYVSLMVTLYARMFNELVYGLAGMSQACQIKVSEMLPITTVKVFMDLWEGKNPLEGRLRSDVKVDTEGFNKYYLSHINELRDNKEALPK